MNVKELNSKFLSLLRCVPYIVDEKPKVHRFLNYLLYHIKDRIEYDNPKTLEEAMRKVNLCYEQNRKKESMTNQKAKRNNKFEQKRKNLFLFEILKIVTPEIFLVKISKGAKVIHRPIQIIKEIKNLLTTTITILIILNERNR